MYLVHDADNPILEPARRIRCPLCEGTDFSGAASGGVPRAGGAANDDVEPGDLTLVFQCKFCGERVVLALPEAFAVPTFDLYEVLAC